MRLRAALAGLAVGLVMLPSQVDAQPSPVATTEIDTVVVDGDVKIASGITIERVPGGTVTRRAGSPSPEWFEAD